MIKNKTITTSCSLAYSMLFSTSINYLFWNILHSYIGLEMLKKLIVPKKWDIIIILSININVYQPFKVIFKKILLVNTEPKFSKQ